ncbi:hypothetical protein N665_0199s0027 [Sinapis alba]|nr:hypothetical protein N665_0199s0027 [Sinapis alba]
MDFTVNWDLLIRLPDYLLGDKKCLQGGIQASLLYKDLTLATSSMQSYESLNEKSPKLLRVSATVSEKDIHGLVGQNIIKDIKEKSEVKFGLRVFLAHCRENSTRVLSYNCDETTLRFDPGSNMKSIASRNKPTCRLANSLATLAEF